MNDADTLASTDPASAGTHAVPLTVIHGDGIGAEVTGAALRVMVAAGANLDVEECRAGKAVFLDGNETGVPAETIESIQRTGVALKGPLETPIGYGQKSANVTLRKMFETFANIRPARELPGVSTPFSGRGIDLVVVRENVEDLYAGIEHMQTPGVAQSLKIISRHGSEKVARLAFEFARADERSRITVATKANIMKLSEGLFQRTFEEVAQEYDDIETSSMLVDNCAHQLAMRPEQFDIILTTNMNGDILSDLTSGLVGGLGFAPSANIGARVALFEAVHGSAPDIAGQNIANPTAIMLSSVMLLRHIGQGEAGKAMEDAILLTLEQATHLTADIARDGDSVGTAQFANAVINNLGRSPSTTTGRSGHALRMPERGWSSLPSRSTKRELAGMDVFVERADVTAGELGPQLAACADDSPFVMKMLSSRGTQLWPGDNVATDTVDLWRARYVRRDTSAQLEDAACSQLLERVGVVAPWMHVEKLQLFDGERSWSKAQGEA